jgi:hypothetical protein
MKDEQHATLSHETTSEERPACFLKIELAPKDGRPIWAKGYIWGDTSGSLGTFCVWAYWDGNVWKEAGVENSSLNSRHLYEYMPLTLQSAVRVIPI